MGSGAAGSGAGTGAGFSTDAIVRRPLAAALTSVRPNTRATAVSSCAHCSSVKVSRSSMSVRRFSNGLMLSSTFSAVALRPSLAARETATRSSLAFAWQSSSDGNAGSSRWLMPSTRVSTLSARSIAVRTVAMSAPSVAGTASGAGSSVIVVPVGSHVTSKSRLGSGKPFSGWSPRSTYSTTPPPSAFLSSMRPATYRVDSATRICPGPAVAQMRAARFTVPPM